MIPWSIPSSRRARELLVELEALPITDAPASCASCTAAEPMPLPTELIITVSPSCEPAAREEHVPGRAERDLERGRLLVGELVGDAHQVPRRSRRAARRSRPTVEKLMKPGRQAERLAAGAAVAAVAAGVHQVRHHAVADLPALDALAELRDPADDLDAEDERQLDREARDALADVDVEVVERARA